MDEKNKSVDEITNEETESVDASDVNITEETDGTEEKEKISRSDKKKLKKAEAELEKLNAELSKKESELAEASDKYMRLYAEYDNFRRRSAKEREGVYADAYADALNQILPIIDNLDRAAQYSAEDPESPMAKGIELTIKSCVEALNKMGVYEIEALGKQFDPNFHNAVMHVDDDSFGENEIVEVFMKGYVKGDKVLRFSMVKVAN